MARCNGPASRHDRWCPKHYQKWCMWSKPDPFCYTRFVSVGMSRRWCLYLDIKPPSGQRQTGRAYIGTWMNENPEMARQIAEGINTDTPFYEMTCPVEGCTNVLFAQGAYKADGQVVCRPHADRFRVFGNFSPEERVNPTSPSQTKTPGHVRCSVPGCDWDARRKGQLCHSHYMRWNNYWGKIDVRIFRAMAHTHAKEWKKVYDLDYHDKWDSWVKINESALLAEHVKEQS